MTIYYTGDTHGNVIERFSYTRNAELRNLTAKDVVFILGDFGVIWEKECDASEEYKLDWMEEKPQTFIAITGNHENYDRILDLPRVEKFGGIMRQMRDNVFIVPDITILDIEDKHILCLPRADSHDIYPLGDMRGDFYHLNTGYSNLIDPSKFEGDRWKDVAKKMSKDGLFYRVVGYSWWPQEKIPVEEYIDFMEKHENEHFDVILSHDAPSAINDWYSKGFGKYTSNEGERYFDMLARTLDFDVWYHGHFHIDQLWPSLERFDAEIFPEICERGYVSAPYEKKMCGLFHEIVSSIEDTKKDFFGW